MNRDIETQRRDERKDEERGESIRKDTVKQVRKKERIDTIMKVNV